jgi:acetyl-CoA/propionyl-CoA carboxylase
MEDPNFIKGDLSTDYLDRFKIFDKLAEDAKKRADAKASAAVAAVLMQSEFVKKLGSNSSNSPSSKSKWKMRGAMI